MVEMKEDAGNSAVVGGKRGAEDGIDNAEEKRNGADVTVDVDGTKHKQSIKPHSEYFC
jgi:hypothetical protein